jgi:putative ABC transport system permease protein
VLDALRRDLALAIRGLFRAPGFATAAVLTLALGIGSTATMFTAVDAAFLHPLPYPTSDRLAMAWQTREGRRHISVSMLDAVDWGKRNHAFAHLAAFYAGPINVSAGGEPRRVTAGNVAQDFFHAIGVQPRIGRTFSDQEMLRNAPPAVIVSDGLWRRAFGGDSRLAGQKLRVEGLEYPVIGVMPAGFDFPERSEAWFALPTADGTERSAHNYSVIGRLRPGVSMARALDPGLPTDGDTMDGLLAADLAQGRFRARLLAGFAALALALAGVGIFGVVSYAARRRYREVGIRMALGADRGSVRSLVMREGMAPVALGMTVGIAAAFALSRLLASLVFEINVADPATFLGVALLLGLAALLSTYLPAQWATRVDPVEALRAE